MRRLLPIAAVLLVLLAPARTPTTGRAAAAAPAEEFAVHGARVEVVQRPFTDEQGGTYVLDRRVHVDGQGFVGTSFGPSVRFRLDGGREVEALMVILDDGRTLRAWPPPGLRGLATLIVENADRRTATATIAL